MLVSEYIIYASENIFVIDDMHYASNAPKAEELKTLFIYLLVVH